MHFNTLLGGLTILGLSCSALASPVNLPRDSLVEMRSAKKEARQFAQTDYIYTKGKGGGRKRDADALDDRSAYIYTQGRGHKDDVDALDDRSAYIYTQGRGHKNDVDALDARSAYIYTQGDDSKKRNVE